MNTSTKNIVSKYSSKNFILKPVPTKKNNTNLTNDSVKLSSSSLTVNPKCAPNALIPNNKSTDIQEEDISFKTYDGIDIKAKITKPAHFNKPLPAILLIAGSGPQDMDVTKPASMTSTGKTEKNFKLLAEELSKAGFAVLRYNKRGVEGYDYEKDKPIVNEEIRKKAGFYDLVEDAKTAFNVLKFQKDINPSKTLLIGHSEGTIIASRLALKEPDIKEIILMGVAGRNLYDILYYQSVERNLNYVRCLDDNHNGLIDKQEYEELKKYMAFNFEEFDLNKDGVLDINKEFSSVFQMGYYESTLPYLLSTKWGKEHKELEPTYEIIEKVPSFITIVQGEEDQQTPISEAYLLVESIKKSKRSDYNLKIFPAVGHFFSPPTGGRIPGLTLGPISNETINWLKNYLLNKYTGD